MSRRKARELAMQAIYQWQLNDMILIDLVKQYLESNADKKVDFKHFEEIVTAAVNHTPELDAVLKPFLDRDIDKLDPVELAILRLSAFELKNRPDIPYRVVINEGVMLAKKYGAQGGHKYINGILDKLATQLRTAE